MNFIISTRAELLKTKRSASFWLTLIAASFVPVLFFLVYVFNPEEMLEDLGKTPWEDHIRFGWQATSSFLFPMYVILICALIPQIEYKNNTWKQVFASPQSTGNIYFSKFLTIQFLLFLFFLTFNIMLLLSGVLANLLEPQYSFLNTRVDWENLGRMNFKNYISVLGISAIQYALSLRFKNFIAPVGIGLALIVLSFIALNFQWKHIDKIPFAHPIRTVIYMTKENRPFLENHEWNSLGYFGVFLLAGFLDLRFRNAKG